MTTVHTYPVRDLIDHDTDDGECPCGPTVEPIPRDDGSIGWHILHHSLDGRERFEQVAAIEKRVSSRRPPSLWVRLTWANRPLDGLHNWLWDRFTNEGRHYWRTR